MTKNEYKVGDRVMFKGDGNLHVITDINEEGLYEVSGSYGWFGARYLEPYERKTAFLTRLQLLLRDFDARIEPYLNIRADIPSIDIYFGNECIESWDRPVNADNIMDFDKK